MAHKLIDRYVICSKEYLIFNDQFFGVQTWNNLVKIPFGCYQIGDHVNFLYWDYRNQKIDEYQDGQVVQSFKMYVAIEDS